MKSTFDSIPRFVLTILAAAAFIFALGLNPAASASRLASTAQGPSPNSLAEQRAAMQKLSFLAGRWSGPATVVVGSGQTLHLTQNENVQYKLGGLVLLIEGNGTDSSGKTVFSALATIAYDDASHQYRFRAYNDGHYLDTELSVTPDGFFWAFTAGPAHVVNTMHLTSASEWHEVTQTSFGGGPAHDSVEMTLHRLK